jgi:heptosyltransferase-2
MRLGIFLPNWIGDVVMATPALRALRRYVGDNGQLIGIMRPYVAEVLEGTPWVDEHIFYNKPRSKFAMASREVYAELRAARLDSVLLLTNSWRTGWMAWRSGARERIGYAFDARSWLLTKGIAPHRGNRGRFVPTVEGYLRLAEAFGAPAEPAHLELTITPAEEQLADAAWRELRLPPGEQVVILNSGGAFGAAKHWPPEHFAELARRIVERRDEELHVLINCGPSEREIAHKIVALADHPRVVTVAAFENLPIGLTKACVRRARLLVTTDSGPRFFGIAFGLPVVSLFGPTDAAATQTGYDRETCLSLALDCQPCMKPNCPLVHHRCMREMSVDYVYNAAAMYLQSGRIRTVTHSRHSIVTSPRLPV